MAMAMTEAHESRWVNATWEPQQLQNPEGMRIVEGGEGEGAGAGGGGGGEYGGGHGARLEWELKDWESITLAHYPSPPPTSSACDDAGKDNCSSSSSLPHAIPSQLVKSEPPEAAAVQEEESEEEQEEEEEEEDGKEKEVVPEGAAAAPLKFGLKLGRPFSSSSSSSSSAEKKKKKKKKKEDSVSQTCSVAAVVVETTTETPVVIAPLPAGVAKAAAAAVTAAGSSSSSSPPSSKKQRVMSPQNPPPPRCQVEGCTADLSSAKDYHRRHKVCQMHSKASKAIAAGCEQRFCQQCSRFHVLTEFDEIKRSCRRRLAGHNERRRKPHPDPAAAFNCQISSPMHTDAFHFHGAAAAASLTLLEDCKQTQFLEQMRASQGGGGGVRPLSSSSDLHDDDEHSNYHHPFANVLNLSSPWRPGENVQSPQHIQVVEKEGQSILLDRRFCVPSSNRLLMFLQSLRGQMRGALDPSSPDVGLSNLSPVVVVGGSGGGSSHEFVDGAKGPLCQNLSLGGSVGGGWENNNNHDNNNNLGCESQSSGCALSLLSWGTTRTTPCPPALNLCIDNTSLDHPPHQHQLVADNNMGSSSNYIASSFATTQHLQQPLPPQEQYLAFEKLYSPQSGALGGGGMGIGDIRITDTTHKHQQPLEQNPLRGGSGSGGSSVGGGGDGASGNFPSYLGGLGLDAGNSMLALFQSSHELQGMRSGLSSAHQSLKKATSSSLQVVHQLQQQQHLHQLHTSSVHSHMQTSLHNNRGVGEFGEFGPSLRACESSLFSTTKQML